MKLTLDTTRTTGLPPGMVEKTYFDDDLAGFGLRVRLRSTNIFRNLVVVYKIGKKNRRIPLLSVTPGTTSREINAARSSAKDVLAKVRLGEDPFAEKLEKRRQIGVTFGALLPAFMKHQASRLKPRSVIEIRRHLEVYAKPWHGMAVTSIDRAAAAVMLTKIGTNNGESTSNRFRASASPYFTWLCKAGHLEVNPMAFTNRYEENGSRERMLSDTELKAIWHAADSGQYGTILRLLMLCGLRREEIGGLCWSEIDLDAGVITLPPPRTKNRREHVIPLAPQVMKILQAQPQRLGSNGQPCDFLFGRADRGYSGWSKGRRELDARLALGTPIAEAWTPHDFRRSLSTTLHERFDIEPHIVEEILGHASGVHREGVAGVYNKARYLPQKRIALEKWADHIEAVVTGKPKSAAVHKLPRRR